MHRSHVRALLLALACGLSACTPTPPDGLFECSATSRCPNGLVCGPTRVCVRDAFATVVAGNGAQLDSQRMSGSAAVAQDAGAASAVLPAAGGGAAVISSAGRVGAGSAATGASGGTIASAAPLCTPNERSCVGDTLVTCSSDGRTRNQTPCPDGCSTARLDCNLCKPGATPFCAQDSMRTCRSDGSSLDIVPCANGCSNEKTLECLSCSATQHICNHRCVEPNDPMACGSTCTVCPEVPHGVSSCSAGSCGYDCEPRALRCDGASACETVSWDFEGSDSIHWAGITQDGTNPTATQVDDGRPALTQERAHGGSGSLRSSVNVTSTRHSYEVTRFLCDNTGSLNLVGKQLQAYIYLTGSTTSSGTNQCAVYESNNAGDGNFASTAFVAIPPDRWTLVTNSINSSAGSNASMINVQCQLGVDSTSSWSGTIYIDDVAAQ